MNRTSRWAELDQIGPGWRPMVAQLEGELAELDPDYEVLQIKEKFGGLRYYFMASDPTKYDAMVNLVQEAEDRSYTICENCGAPGTPGGNGWIVTLCDECRAKR